MNEALKPAWRKHESNNQPTVKPERRIARTTKGSLKRSVGAVMRWRGSSVMEASVVAGAVILAALTYSLITGQMWEDFFITFRHSQNLCEGKGLLYNPGERVHGFTSPLGTLLPAVCYLITGGRSYLAALWLFRFLSMAAMAAGGLLFFRGMKGGSGQNHLVRWAFVLLFCLESKAIAFSTNGMETGWLLLFLGWAFYLFSRDFSGSWLAGGVCWAGLLWTRPDGSIYIIALALASFLFQPDSRKKQAGALGKCGVVGAALYLPWLGWAWSYYGTPIPQTVFAKAAPVGDFPDQIGQTVVRVLQHYPEMTARVFQPIYFDLGEGWLGDKSWDWLITTLSAAMGGFCAVYWVFPTPDRVGRMASLCFALSAAYLASLNYVCPWYMPPVIVFGLVVLTKGVFTLGALARRAFPRDEILGLSRALAVFLILTLCLAQMFLFGLTVREMEIQQRVIENEHRTLIGLWLKDHVREGQSVYLEPLGYIGFFSGAHMIDWPGLVTPEVVRLRDVKRLDMFTMIPELTPDWVVLRQSEFLEMSRSGMASFFKDNYILAKEFDVKDRIEHYSFLPGKPYLLYDAQFYVFRRKSRPQLVPPRFPHRDELQPPG